MADVGFDASWAGEPSNAAAHRPLARAQGSQLVLPLSQSLGTHIASYASPTRTALAPTPLHNPLQLLGIHECIVNELERRRPRLAHHPPRRAIWLEQDALALRLPIVLREEEGGSQTRWGGGGGAWGRMGVGEEVGISAWVWGRRWEGGGAWMREARAEGAEPSGCA